MGIIDNKSLQPQEIDYTPARIGKYSLKEYLELVKSFHGHVAPGLLAGGIMVDLAIRGLPAGILFDAFCETDKCLPDAVQLLTPCTVGNGWLKILDLGRFALCLYEKHTGQGIRVFLDAKKIKALPAITTWFFKLQPKDHQDSDLLFNEMKQAGESIYSIQEVKVLGQHLKRKKMGERSICKICGEAYPAIHGVTCRACQGQTPYLSVN
jgi:formylmethanofuran dehydrogenase subunit E